MSKTYKKSPTGMYRITLLRPVEYRNFVYKPGHEHTVSETILEAIKDSVDNVVPAG